MCFGGGGSSEYDAYKTGDFNRWKAVFDKRSEIETRLARGEISKEQADLELKALEGTGGGGGLGDTGNSGGGAGGSYAELMNRIKSDPNAGMELRELLRQHDVNVGRIGIDKAYGQFNDDYYKNYRDTYTGYYTPELDRQYSQVGDKATASLAERGMLESSVGANTFGNLAREYADARTGITSEALDQSNKLRGTVENSKSSLYSMNEASANPQAVNAQAIGSATALVAPPTYSPLGQIFANSLNSLAQYSAAARNRPATRYSSPYSGATGSGSMKVVS